MDLDVDMDLDIGQCLERRGRRRRAWRGGIADENRQLTRLLAVVYSSIASDGAEDRKRNERDKRRETQGDGGKVAERGRSEDIGRNRRTVSSKETKREADWDGERDRALENGEGERE